jgi:multiple sugar transport system substrate-binding protein
MLLGAGAVAAATLADGRPAHAAIPTVNVEPPKQPIEPGATLRVLRPVKYVEPDQVWFDKNSAAFTQATGVKVRVDYVGFEDLRPQTAVAARTGAGPDIVLGWGDDPHLYTDKTLDLTELANYLGTKYGGWEALAANYGRKWKSDTWIAIPFGGSGGPAVYRKSWVKAAGYDTIPSEHDKFLDLCRKLKANGHPPGFALGNSVGDANSYVQWLLWSHGGYLVDDDGKIALDRPETIEALKYAKELYQTFIPGVLSWQDPSNNKAFIAEEISLTQNGVSVYFVLKNDPKTAAIAADTDHAPMPSGRMKNRPETASVINSMVFKHSKFPNAAKEYIRFMLEAEQYDPWLTATAGYWAAPLKAYRESAVWKSDPKLLPYRDACAMEYWSGYKGPITAASGAVSADYVLVQMFAAVSAGQATPEDAVAEATRRAKRTYKQA